MIIQVLFGRHIQEYALQVQVEFQKKLHDMVERTLLEVHCLPWVCFECWSPVTFWYLHNTTWPYRLHNKMWCFLLWKV